MPRVTALLLPLALASSVSLHAQAAAPDPRAIVKDLDTRYQAAVKANDAAGMDAILDDDMILVTGRGTVVTKQDLLRSARSGTAHYEHQDPSQQVVRVWGDHTAVVTALLWIKGTSDGTPFDYKLWYSDTYVLTPTGWRYAFGQASLRLPEP